MERIIPKSQFGNLSGKQYLQTFQNGRFDVTRVPEHLRSLDSLVMRFGGLVMVYGGAVLGASEGISDRLLIPVKDSPHWFRKGCTLEFDFLHAQDEYLSKQVQLIRAQFQEHPGVFAKATMYISPSGSGLSAHFDAYANFVFQVSGQKTWKLEVNENISSPTEHFDLKNYPNLPSEIARSWKGIPPDAKLAKGHCITLKPGDWMFVPIGYWHATEASSEESVSFNVTLSFPSKADIALKNLRNYLVSDPYWRARDFEVNASCFNNTGRLGELLDSDELLNAHASSYDTYQEVTFLNRQLYFGYWNGEEF